LCDYRVGRVFDWKKVCFGIYQATSENNQSFLNLLNDLESCLKTKVLSDQRCLTALWMALREITSHKSKIDFEQKVG